MNAGNYYGSRDLRVEQVPDPTPAAGEVLVRVTAAGICGSDLHEYRGEYSSPPGTPLRIMGHELAGVVWGLGQGAGEGLQTGTHVGINPLVGCGSCAYCRSGMIHLCDSLSTIGIHRPGGFAEFTCVPAVNCYALPGSVTDEAAALLDVYACAMHGLSRLPVKPGDSVAVIGSGAMAMAFAELSRLAGASLVFMVGRRKATIERVAGLAGAVPVAQDERNPLEAIKSLTDGRGVDIVYECVGGTGQTLAIAMQMSRKGGSLGIEGVHIQPQTINSTDALIRELCVVWFNSHGMRGTRNEFEIALSLMAEHRISPGQMITHRFTLERISEAFAAAQDHTTTGSIKVIVNPT